MGGGGYSMEPENLLLDDYILKQARTKNPKICVLPTATGDAQTVIDKFYNHFANKKCIPTHLSLFKGEFQNLESFVLEQDIIYVSGGNTRNLLALWKEWNLDKILFKAYENGTILSGLSAGAICWFEQGLTDSIPFQLSKLECLGFLKGSFCPHFNNETERQDIYKSKILTNEMKAGFACDDSVALHFIDNELVKVVSSVKNVKAYYFENENNILKEKILEPEFLEIVS